MLLYTGDMKQSKYLAMILTLVFALPAHSVPITAASWLVATGEGKIIDGKNTQEVRSIASITKLVTAMVVLDAGQQLDEQVTIYTRRQLLQLALIGSNNNAAVRLCEAYPNGHAACIRAMNAKMFRLGLVHTKFIESTGLSVFNVSTVQELITIVLEAQQYPEIVKASNTSQVKIKSKKNWLVINNTNPIIGNQYDVIVSKTGYINASGGCIVMMLNTDIGRRIIVVLGSKNTHTRIPEALFLVKNY